MRAFWSRMAVCLRLQMIFFGCQLFEGLPRVRRLLTSTTLFQRFCRWLAYAMCAGQCPLR